MKETEINEHDPVTVIVKHCVLPGKEIEYQEWAIGITEAARQFDGYLGVNFIRPSAMDEQHHILIFKFNSYENMLKWEESPERAYWKDKRKHITKDEPEIHRYKGWDYWFTLPPSAKIAPPRYKMALITLVSIYPLALFVPMLLNPFIGFLPQIIVVLITAAAIVPLMLYLVMPTMVKIFSWWLYPDRKQRPGKN
jgi:antibiotic biosynthesis monooxygenase (ABM) superfamily enzyme